jgi:hypothetical protein
VTWQPDIRPDTSPRLWAAWQTMLITISDGKWHPRPSLIQTMTAAGVAPRTALNLLDRAHKEHITQRRGRGQSHLVRARTQHIAIPDPPVRP